MYCLFTLFVWMLFGVKYILYQDVVICKLIALYFSFGISLSRVTKATASHIIVALRRVTCVFALLCSMELSIN